MALLFNIISCTPTTGDVGNNRDLVGTWEYTGSKAGGLITFEQNGNVYFQQRKNSKATYSGTYSVKGSTLTLNMSWTMENTGVSSAHYENYSISISSDRLTLNFKSGKWETSAAKGGKIKSTELNCLIAQCWMVTTGRISLEKAVVIEDLTKEEVKKLCEKEGTSYETITEFEIPDGVETIGEEAFRDCNKLKKVTIPDSVTSIGEYAFYDCSNLTSIKIPDSVTSIGEYAFYDCSNLTSIKIPDSVTSIGVFAFSRCSSLTSISIPDSVTSIEDSTFSRCTSLTSITIPNSVTSIRNEAFYGCSNLTSITINATNPPNVSSDWFYPYFRIPDNCKIYVPASSVNSYKSAYPWKNHADQIFAIGDTSSSDDDNDDNESGGSVSSSDINGTYEIVDARDGATFTMDSGDWTFDYFSNYKTGTYSLNGSNITINYSAGGQSVSAVFKVSSTSNGLNLTAKSGEYTTVIGTVFMITDIDVLEGTKPVKLTRQ